MKESICKRCEHLRYCGASIVDKELTVMTGCSRFEKRKSITNYDSIIHKTPEELAKLFTHLCCPYSLGGKVECNIENKGCKACWLDWLKQEATP